MRGVFFQKPIEFNLQIEGERWNQGDSVHGTLTVKNHGGEPLPLSEISVHLAHGVLKKVHEKKPGALSILFSTSFQDSKVLAPQASAELPWKFKTDRNCPITDKTGSLFVVYGRGAELETCGNLQLIVQPYPLIDAFLQEFKTHFRFVLKTMKSSKNAVEAKLAPPDSRVFLKIDELFVSFEFSENEALSVDYEFRLKKLEATAANLGIVKSKKEFSQKIEKNQYLTESGRWNAEFLEQSIKVALDQLS